MEFELDWWFKQAMCILCPLMLVLAVAAFAPWPSRHVKSREESGRD